MNLVQEFTHEVDRLCERQNGLSKALTILYRLGSRVGYWVLVPILVYTILGALIVYFVDPSTPIGVVQGAIVLACTIFMIYVLRAVTDLVFKNGSAKLRLIYSLQRIINSIKIESADIIYAQKKFDKLQDKEEKLYTLNFIMLSIQEVLDIVESERVALSKMEHERAKAEIVELESLVERVEDAFNFYADKRIAFIKENHLEHLNEAK